ncbi:MAG: hypothetical protein H0T84_13285 [Tatlockia sp.]|nr:hypothetical protein [Tatlockia sp.]
MKNEVINRLSIILIIICFGISSKVSSKGVKNPNEDNEVYATFTATSDYIWRGFSQTTHRPAFHGEYNLTIPKSPIKGLYANLWFSNVRFREEESTKMDMGSKTSNSGEVGDSSDNSPMNQDSPQESNVDSSIMDGPNRAFMEFDASIGITNEISKYASYDIWFVRYLYPGPTKLTYNEYMGEFKLFFLTTLVGYTNNVYATRGKAFYYNIGFDFKVPDSVFKVKNLHFRGGIGHYYLPVISEVPSYSDYNLQIDKNFNKFAVSIMWTNTSDRSRPYGGNRVSLAVYAFL